jgi:hypothetical protein
MARSADCRDACKIRHSVQPQPRIVQLFVGIEQAVCNSRPRVWSMGGSVARCCGLRALGALRRIGGGTVALTWGDFQPILHLSIALNAAYAALYSFIDDVIKRETKVAQSVRDSVPIGQKKEARALLSKIYDYENELEVANRNYLKPICIVFSLFGVVLLVISAYSGSLTPISSWLAFIIVILLAPFFLAMVVYGSFFVLLSCVSAQNRKLLAGVETHREPKN